MTALLRTSLALITRPMKGFVEMRFRTDATISLPGIQEIFEKLDHHGWTAPEKLLVVFPDHPVDFDLPVISTDHLEGRPGAQDTGRALALVVRDPVNDRFVRLHLAHFPIPFDTRIFVSEDEARAWLGVVAPV